MGGTVSCTRLETNMEPTIMPLEKESLPSHHFRGSMLAFRGVAHAKPNYNLFMLTLS